jgi:hypothetical protein
MTAKCQSMFLIRDRRQDALLLGGVEQLSLINMQAGMSREQQPFIPLCSISLPFIQRPEFLQNISKWSIFGR